MSELSTNSNLDLAAKIARLVEERGYNQEDFANISDLNRQTVRQILQPTGTRRLRNATVAACARALGLSVNDLRTLTLDQLLSRISQPPRVNGDEKTHTLFDRATQPELRAWIERNPDRVKLLTGEEVEELLALQSPNGPFGAFGVEHFVSQLERRRTLLERVRAIASTEYVDLLEELVDLMFEKVQPSRDRTG